MELGDSPPSISTARQDKSKPENPFDEVTPQAFSSSSTVIKEKRWDVFINHCGRDVKHNLARTIYYTLGLFGLNVFLDNEELHVGNFLPKIIEDAICTAGVHIAIFSKTYAESPWLLVELSYMLETGKPIIPVFYHVQPSDLRWVENGFYAPAFHQHEKKGRYSSTILENWKSALHKVSYLSGCMSNSPIDDEWNLLKHICNSVLRTMKKVPLEVAKHPVAMDEIVEDFEQGRSIQGEQHVQIVGILGLGGSGKTTLATELYNRKRVSFDRSSFVRDVRDAASKSALHTKQKKLLEDLRMQAVTNFDNSKEGKGLLADQLNCLRVLLVLDDVDHEDQLDALLPAKESLGSGSLVIVTTRQGDVLSKWGVTSIYKIKPLQHLHASTLFCWHAFLQPFPQQGFEDLVEKFVDVSSGLPLFLKVIGGQLYGESKDYWESQLQKIQRILPDEIKQKLKVSYDALNKEEQEMFLDIACFFIGEEKSLATEVWDGSGLESSCLRSLETLQNKCLVEVDEEERLRMHDHLRDLGREIAKTHSIPQIWSERHLGASSTARQDKRDPENAFNTSMPQLSSSSSSTGIVNSVLKAKKKGPSEVSKHSIGMDQIVEDFERSQKEYIESEQRVQVIGIVGLGGSGKSTVATELYNRKTSFINRSSFLHDVRDAASKNALHTKQNKLLEDLRIQTASFDGVKEGKEILQKSLISHRVLIVLDDVDHENQLDALLPPTESLRSGSLIIVTTREMGVLTSWGITCIHEMQPLQHPYARCLFCWHAFLQPSPQQGFENLVELCLDACNGLPLSLKVIGGLLNGERSKGYWYSQIKKIRRILPGEITEMLRVSYDALDEQEKEVFLDVACFFIGERTSLAIAVWDGSGWSGQQNWETLQKKCLVEMDEEGRVRMHDYLRDLGRDIAKMHSPSRIWSQGQNMHIQRGNPTRGITVTDPPPPFKEYMETMRISDPGFAFQLLTVKENYFSQEFEELSSDLLWLRWLNFKHGYISSWLSLKNVRVLELLEPLQLEALWDDTQPPSQLRELLIKNAPKLQSLPRSIGRLKHLKRLSLDCDFKDLRLPEEFCQLYSLEHLVIRECHKLSSLPNDFGDLLNLRRIDLSENWSLQRLPMSFKQLIHLEYLNLSGCHNLTLKSDTLEHITKLQVFYVPFCNKLKMLPHNITNQASLEKLDLRYTMNLEEIPASIGQLNKLKKLEIVWSRNLTRLPISLGNLTGLSTLTLDGCPELCEMPSLAGLVSLNNLNVKKCDKIKKIEGLEHLLSLENLLAWTCWMEPGIRSLGSTETLRTLNLQADNISAFETCIESIETENWPWEMTISARVPPHVQSILYSFTFPGVTVVDSLEVDRSNLEIERWSLTCRETNLANAAMVCFLVRSVRSIAGDSSLVINEGESTRIEVGEGEWIVISVFREVSSLIMEGGRSLQASIDVQPDFPYLNFDVLGGKLIVGERGPVAKAFKQLFHIPDIQSWSVAAEEAPP